MNTYMHIKKMKLHKLDVYMIMQNKMMNVKLEACNDHRINKCYAYETTATTYSLDMAQIRKCEAAAEAHC